MVVTSVHFKNLYTCIRKHLFKMETTKSVHQWILVNDCVVSIDRTDAYLHVPVHPQTGKYLLFFLGNQVFQFTALPFGMSLIPWIFTKLMDVIAASASTCHLTFFVSRRLAHKRSYTRQTNISHSIRPPNGKSLGFIPNLKKKLDLNPAQQFTFIVWNSDTTKYSQGTT